MMKPQPLTKYQKEGLWLAVISRRNKLLVAAADATINKVLQKADNLGFKDVSLVKSAKNYAMWAPTNS